ncbi:glycolate oxidase subunit GlcF [Neptunomonas japonica]|uniref:Glycolate oxidase iron-sulfur subunit n=1 Tax=Neptunomonas japonica JAMM 1380 TaxID=1441457 RepID=A0A7R6PAK1_9GAMM|nr:glycolate oxidase subunit GlcF [Neptunomonas japonica]BBB30273.1 glycolate oxidase iron-sulfur subunit [Neptunomonas japonica JAMM 1380]
MQTNIAEFINSTAQGKEADAILRKCVHCGFCLATCPTYNLRGNELDSPRGRIYLIKQVLEGQPASTITQSHLDACLNCRACETTCPANVDYHRLLDIGVQVVEKQVPRSFAQKVLRQSILGVLPYPTRFTPLLRAAQHLRPLLPSALKIKIPLRPSKSHWPKPVHKKRMLVLEGCVQPGLAPDINAATARVLSQFDISLITADKAGCCGAINYHLNKQEDGRDFMRNNIDAWWPIIEEGCEAIVMTASGCGSTVKEYGTLLKDDGFYAEKAARISTLTKDLVEVLTDLPLEKLSLNATSNVAFQCPCSLQHAQGLSGSVETVLTRLGFPVKAVSDGHTCCGSAGTYSIFQPELATQLGVQKVKALEKANPDIIGSANIGCMTHLSSKSKIPIQHWIQIIDAAMTTAHE